MKKSFWISVFLIVFVTTNDVSSEPSDYFYIGTTTKAHYEADALDAEIAYKLLFDEILVSANEQTSIKVYNSFDMLWNDYKKDLIDSCIASSLELIDHLHEFNPNGIYTMVSDGSPYTHYLLLVKKDAYKSINDLVKKNIGMIQEIDVGRMYLDVELMERSLPKHVDFFDQIVQEKNSHTAIVNLLFGNLDSILIPKDGYEAAIALNPSIRDNITILLESEGFLNSIVAMRKDFPEERFAKIQHIATTLHKTPKGKHLLKMFRNERIMTVDINHLKSVVDLRNRYQELNKTF